MSGDDDDDAVLRIHPNAPPGFREHMLAPFAALIKYLEDHGITRAETYAMLDELGKRETGLEKPEPEDFAAVDRDWGPTSEDVCDRPNMAAWIVRYCEASHRAERRKNKIKKTRPGFRPGGSSGGGKARDPRH